MDAGLDSKQQKMHALDLKKRPPATTSPKLEKGLSKTDRKRHGWTIYMQRGRA